MINYFVVFNAECDGELPRNDVIEVSREIRNVNDVKNIEEKIRDKWFGDDREITLINFKKI